MQEFLALYQPWEIDEHPDALMIDVRWGRSRWTGGRRYRIHGAGQTLFSVRDRREVLPHLEWGINWQVVKEVGRFLQIHAAVVARQNQCIVLPASPQSGKTTLCAGLVARGWRFLSDEFALIDPVTFRVHPYPKAMCVKSGSFDVVRNLPLPLNTHTRYKKGRKGRVAYVSLARQPDQIGTQSDVRWIVFPRYAPGQAPQLTPVTRGQAAFQLRQLSFNFDRFGSAGLDVIRRASLRARAFELNAGSLADTCDLIEKMVEEAPASTSGNDR